MISLITVEGPTATVKRLLRSLWHASLIQIISADSRQVDKYMDIGNRETICSELNAVPHHLIVFSGTPEC
jgi:tRNA A37 N6-isopentenylltransferase MiaA